MDMEISNDDEFNFLLNKTDLSERNTVLTNPADRAEKLRSHSEQRFIRIRRP